MNIVLFFLFVKLIKIKKKKKKKKKKKNITMASLNCYPKPFIPSAATVILYGEKTAYSYPDLTLDT